MIELIEFVLNNEKMNWSISRCKRIIDKFCKRFGCKIEMLYYVYSISTQYFNITAVELFTISLNRHISIFIRHIGIYLR